MYLATSALLIILGHPGTMDCPSSFTVNGFSTGVIVVVEDVAPSSNCDEKILLKLYFYKAISQISLGGILNNIEICA